MAKARKDPKGRALQKGEYYEPGKKRYVYSYYDVEHKRRYVYEKDLLKLREREKKLVKDQLDGLNVYVNGKVTLNFVYDRYIATKTELREHTRTNYNYFYDQYVRDGFGKRKIADIKYSDVLIFYKYLIIEKKIGVSTLENINTTLHPTFTLAVRDEIIRKNPSDGVMKEIKKMEFGKKAGIRHALTVEQEASFVKYFDEKEGLSRWRNIIVFWLGTGCRVGEMIALRWDDIDFKEKMITIDHSISYFQRNINGEKKCVSVLNQPKTEAGIRKIPMLPSVYDALMDEKRFQEETGQRCVSVVDGMHNFIFFNRFHAIHKPGALNRMIKRVVEDHNSIEQVKAKREKRDPVIIPHISCHSLRHTFCSRLCEKSGNVKFVQEVMGHKDIQTTLDIYAELSDSVKKEIVEKIANEIDIIHRSR